MVSDVCHEHNHGEAICILMYISYFGPRCSQQKSTDVALAAIMILSLGRHIEHEACLQNAAAAGRPDQSEQTMTYERQSSRPVDEGPAPRLVIIHA